MWNITDVRDGGDVRDEPDLQRYLQYNRDLQWVYHLRLVQHMRQHSDVRRRLCNVLWSAVVRCSRHVSLDIHLRGFHDLPQHHV